MRIPLSAVVAVVALVVTACAPDPDHSPSAGGDGGGGGAEEHGHDDAAAAVASDARRLAVSGDGFRFQPASITISAGEPIAIEFTSGDILHDFVIDELDAHVVAEVGETAQTGLIADRPGTYTYYCSVPGHREAGMVGTLIVT